MHAWTIPKKTSFLSEVEKPQANDPRRHLRIVVSDADDKNRQIVVSVTTLRFEYQDKSCVIYPNEHEFIIHESIIDFRYTKIMTSVEILNGIMKKLLIKKEDISDALLKRIQNALKQSKYIPNEVKDLFPYL